VNSPSVVLLAVNTEGETLSRTAHPDAALYVDGPEIAGGDHDVVVKVVVPDDDNGEPAAPTLAQGLGPDAVERALRTLAELWSDSDIENLSQAQRDTAAAVLAAVQAQDADAPHDNEGTDGSCSDDCPGFHSYGEDEPDAQAKADADDALRLLGEQP
jgi:hypothetical protein